MRDNFFLPLLFLMLSLNCSLYGQQGFNMAMTDVWDVDTLPDRNGVKYNDVWGYADCENREYAILGSAAYIHILNVSNPWGVTEIAAIPGTTASVWRDFKTYKDRAYAVADQGEDGLYIIDMSQVPDTATLVNQITTDFTRAHNIFVDPEAGWLYVVGSNSDYDVLIYDLRDDPDNPVLVSTVDLPGGYVHDIHVRYGLGFCSHGNNGLYVYDFSTPMVADFIGSLANYEGAGYNHSSWLTNSGLNLIFADETHGRKLKMVDVSNLGDMQVINQFGTALLAPDDSINIAHNPFIRGNLAYVSYYHDGVQVYDISSPDSIVHVAGYDTYPDNDDYAGFEGCWGVYPFLNTGIILASDMTYGLQVLSLIGIPIPGMGNLLVPDAVLTPADTLVSCDPEGVDLTLSSGAQIVDWYKDGERMGTGFLNFTATEPGNYYAKLFNGPCEWTTDTLHLSFEDPLPEIGFSDYIFCTNDEILIQAPEDYESYDLYLGDSIIYSGNAANIPIEENGIYKLEFFAGACSVESNEFEVDVAPVPEEDYILINETCIDFSIQIPGNSEQIYRLLRDGEEYRLLSDDYDFEEDGTYQIEVSLNDCILLSDEFEIEISFPEPSVISLDGALLVASEAQSYQWMLNDQPIAGATTSTYEALVSGEYSVMTVDLGGCEATSNSVGVVISDVEEVNYQQVRVYPNPASSYLEIDYSSTGYTLINWYLYDGSGRLLSATFSQQNSKVLHLDTNDLNNGLYFIRLQDEDGKDYLVRFVK